MLGSSYMIDESKERQQRVTLRIGLTGRRLRLRIRCSRPITIHGLEVEYKVIGSNVSEVSYVEGNVVPR